MLQKLQSHPIVKRLLWLLFAVLFYQSGLAFTVWLLEPASFSGGLQWFWLMLFPVFLPAFFVVNRYLGCASGCASGANPNRQRETHIDNNPLAIYQQPPG